MLRIRFTRVGKKNAASFRLVLTPKLSSTKNGKFLEILGFYNPRTKEKGIHGERISYWLSQGALPSDTAHNFLVKEGVIKAKKRPVHAVSKKKEEVKSETVASEAVVKEAVKAEAKEEEAKEEVKNEAVVSEAVVQEEVKVEAKNEEVKEEAKEA